MPDSNAKLPAFPTQTKPGLTKREYFAAMAMQGIVASCCAEFCPSEDRIAEMSKEQADALIQALESAPAAEEVAHVDL